jgi:GNAT superfamily N-acetyltransferase
MANETADRTAVRVRPFDPTDREFVLSLAPRLLIGIPPWRDPAAMQQAVEEWLVKGMDQQGRESFVFVAEDANGERLGVATVAPSRHFTGTPQAELGELAVRAEAEGWGVGQALVAACVAWARAEGYPFLALGTGAANTRARHFYARLGFLEEDVRLVRRLDEPAE